MIRKYLLSVQILWIMFMRILFITTQQKKKKMLIVIDDMIAGIKK